MWEHCWSVPSRNSDWKSAEEKSSGLPCICSQSLERLTPLASYVASRGHFFLVIKMGASLESVNALKSRVLEVALSPAEANALETNGITSLARLAFAACHPGQTPTEAQLQPLLQPIPLNPGNTASLKRLIFESQTLVCNEVKLSANRKDDAARTPLAGPERDARVQQQKNRLTGFLFRGEEECSHSSYDITLAMLEKDCLIYLGPEKFPTRCSELTQKKPRKGISIDQ